MFGNLLEGNTDSDRKTPAAVRHIHGDAVADAVEKSAVTVSSPAYADWGDAGTLTFRFCLGDNTTTNFDIRRNTLYNVVLTATESGFAIKDWKAELDLTDRRELIFRSAENVGQIDFDDTVSDHVIIYLFIICIVRKQYFFAVVSRSDVDTQRYVDDGLRRIL